MATLRRSNGTIISSAVTQFTLKKIIQNGDGAPTSAGDQSHSDVTLIPAKDALYLAATSPNPVFVGVDHVTFLPRRYPES